MSLFASPPAACPLHFPSPVTFFCVCFWKCGFVLPWLYIYLMNSNIIYLRIFLTYSPNEAECYLATFYISSVGCSLENITLCVFKPNRKEKAHTKTHTLTHIQGAERKAVSLTYRVVYSNPRDMNAVRFAGGWKPKVCCNGYHVFNILQSYMMKSFAFLLQFALRLWSNGNGIKRNSAKKQSQRSTGNY